MKIHGLQKMTLLDYPGKVACTIFTPGCNFRCPFCHNTPLVTDISSDTPYTPEDIFEFLNKRKGLLDGVCITGGEPLMQSGIAEFIKTIKDMGFFVKLDTNGSFPDKLIDIVNSNNVDYVAMDIKNCKEKYALTAGADIDILPNIEKSIRFLINGNIDYEFRTTVVDELHTVPDIEKIAQWILGAKHYFLQPFFQNGDIVGKNEMHSPDKSTLIAMKKAARTYIKTADLRGTD